jgi:hypothetical protein
LVPLFLFLQRLHARLRYRGLFAPALLVATFECAAFAQQPLYGPPPQQDALARERIEREAAEELAPQWQSIRQEAYLQVDHERESAWRAGGYVYPKKANAFDLAANGVTLSASTSILVASSGVAGVTKADVGFAIYRWFGAFASVGLASQRLYNTSFLSVPVTSGLRFAVRDRDQEFIATLGANFDTPIEHVRATYTFSIAPELGTSISFCMLRTAGTSCLGLGLHGSLGIRIPTHSDSDRREMMRARAYFTMGLGPTWLY